MTITRSEDRNKSVIQVYELFKIKYLYFTPSFDKHFSTVFTDEFRIAKFCNEMYVIPEYFMNKLSIIV